MTHEAFRVWRALKLALCFAFCGVPGAGFEHAAGLELTRQVAKVVVVAAEGFVAHLTGVAAQRPSVGDVFGLLKIRRLLIEIGLLQSVIDRAGLFHVIALGRGLFGQQMKAVETALDSAYGLTADDQALRGAVLVVAADLVQAVFAVVFPDQPASVVAQKIVGLARTVGTVAIMGADGRLTVSGVGQMLGDPAQGRTCVGMGECMSGIVIAHGFPGTARGVGLSDA